MKKILSCVIICLLSFGPVFGPLSLYAEELTATDSAQVATEVDSPEPSPEPTPAPEATSSAEITTGDAISVTEAENQVNTTEVNSEVIFRTLNIFLDSDIDLTAGGTIQTIVDQAITDNPETAEISVSYNGTNIAYVSNTIVSEANTGNNEIDSATDSAITTGDAYSIVSLLNQVNTTIINSQIYLVTINIFGDINANIILPELETGGSTAPCCEGQEISINNQATVSSQINSGADSGQNTVVAATDAVIESGDAQSTVNVVNVVNTNLVNTTVVNLVINVLGEWLGNWIGADEWQNPPLESGEASCPDCLGNIAIDNQAYVENDITSLANTGGNEISASSGQIKTGRAYSAVSLFNFINTNIINSRGFWGFINIFGRLTGNVGTAAALFPEATPEPSPEATTEATEPTTRDSGGLLTIEQSNNVGEYVLPGDTVTFTVLIKNPGAGKVYDAKLWLGLTQGGNNRGGGWIRVGDIDAHKGIKISSGLVLSQEAQGGQYTGLAKVVGYVGPDNQEITASAESSFLLAAFSPVLAAIAAPVQAEEPLSPVLGTTIAAGVTPYERLLKLFWAMLALYSLMLIYEKREKLAYAAMALRSLIFSLLFLITTP